MIFRVYLKGEFLGLYEGADQFEVVHKARIQQRQLQSVYSYTAEPETYITKALADARLGDMPEPIFADLYEDEGGNPEIAELIRVQNKYPFSKFMALDFLYSDRRKVLLSMNYHNLAREIKKIKGSTDLIEFIKKKANKYQLLLIEAVVTGTAKIPSFGRKDYEHLVEIAKALNDKKILRKIQEAYSFGGYNAENV